MTSIIVGGHRLPAPDAYIVGHETIGAFERNANGNMVGDLVAVKTVLTLGWKMLDDGNFKRILSHVRPFFVKVEYYDPDVGERREKMMYARPGGGKVALDGDGQLWWRDVGCVFVER
ncbi:MAG: hypothetical protein FWC93_05900 [Defluviitaleaceae bacterium]|nr:hypothetical protein [Defluviitaleaceae bacterium]